MPGRGTLPPKRGQQIGTNCSEAPRSCCWVWRGADAAAAAMPRLLLLLLLAHSVQPPATSRADAQAASGPDRRQFHRLRRALQDDDYTEPPRPTRASTLGRRPPQPDGYPYGDRAAELEDSFPFQDWCSRSCSESPWRLVGVSKYLRGRTIQVFCLQLQRRASCTASPCCNTLTRAVDAVSISVAATGTCNTSSIVRVTSGGIQLNRVFNYPLYWTEGSEADVGLMVTDLSSLGLPTDNLELCYETRTTCKEWTDVCRSSAPGSEAGCSFSVSETNADGWFTCCNTCPLSSSDFAAAWPPNPQPATRSPPPLPAPPTGGVIPQPFTRAGASG
ncbi:hypothetical protein PLESTF_000825700 [Pleodorina starrii]|nr:hypothetical protein PLESTF_000825700 [Pleodorina starrii]